MNHMVHYDPATTFHALADASRLSIVSRLAEGPTSAAAFVAPLGMSLQAVRKHLAVLEDAGLLSSVKRGRVRLCRIELAPLKQAEAWMASRARLWERRLDALGDILEKDEKP